MIEKEFRALLPLWTACVAAMIAARLIGEVYTFFAVPGYLLGTIALGAYAVGHEYSHHTVNAMLTLPMPRRRIWLSKLVALTPLVLMVCTLGRWVFPNSTGTISAPTYYLPAVAALCIAPCLTMATRSSLAGTVFTFSIGGTLMVLGEWLGIRAYGYTPAVDAFRLQFMWWSIGSLSLLGAILGWRMFLGLESLEGEGLHINVPAFGGSRSRTARKRHPVWVLIGKELRLQQLAWVVTVLYFVGFVLLTTRSGTREVGNYVSLISLLYQVVLSVLIGSLACAEERQFGTAETQLLLPMSAARQWTLKAGTALAMAVLLGAVLPELLSRVLLPGVPGTIHAHSGVIMTRSLLLTTGLASLSLYVSTLSSSGLRALLLSGPVIFATWLLVERVAFDLSYRISRALWYRDGLWRGRPLVSPDTFFPAAFAVLFLLVLWLALPNYRWTDRNRVRIGLQATGMAVALCAMFALAGLLRIR